MDTEQRDICEVLGQLGVFRSLAYGHLRDVVEIGCIRDYRTGKSLYYQGDLADWAYLIVSGAVRRVKYRVNLFGSITVFVAPPTLGGRNFSPSPIG